MYMYIYCFVLSRWCRVVPCGLRMVPRACVRAFVRACVCVRACGSSLRLSLLPDSPFTLSF